MRVLVTGAAGFTGRRLVRHLRATGHDVIATARSGSSTDELVCGDLRDPRTLSRVGPVDAVCHVAAAVVLGGLPEVRAQAFDENLAATYAVLRWCETTGVARLVYSSSSSVYARTEASIDEQAALDPLTPYAAGKLAGEWLVSSRLLRTVSSVILRYTSIYGEGQRGTSVLPMFVRAVREGRRPAVYGSGARSQDFVHVDDVCEANRLVLEAELPFGEVFNIGSGEETSMLALAEAVVQRFGGEGVERVAADQEDMTRVRFDVVKARRVLGYAPRNLVEGLRTY